MPDSATPPGLDSNAPVIGSVPAPQKSQAKPPSFGAAADDFARELGASLAKTGAKKAPAADVEDVPDEEAADAREQKPTLTLKKAKTPDAEAEEDTGDDDPDGGEPGPEDTTDIEKNEKFVAVARERDELRKYATEAHEFVSKTIARERELEDELEDVAADLDFLRKAIDAAGLEINPMTARERELEKKLRAHERKERRATETNASREAAIREARRASFDAAMKSIAAVHGVDEARLRVAIRHEWDIAKLEKRQPRKPDAIAQGMKAPAKSEARAAPPTPHSRGRGGRISKFPHTAEGDAAFVTSVLARHGKVAR